MSVVRFTRGSNAILVDVPAVRTWTLASSGQAGEATITLPYSSPAADANYIASDGGSWVTIMDSGGCGVWRGITTEPQWGTNEMTITARQPWAILGQRITSTNRVLRNVPSGLIVTTLWRDAMAGVTFLRLANTTIEGVAGNIDVFAFGGRDVWSVLQELMDRTNGELHIDASSLLVYWTGQYAFASKYATQLVAGSDLLEWEYRPEQRDRVAEVIVRCDDAGQEYRLRSGDSAVANWPAQSLVRIDSVAKLASTAQAELNQRSATAATLTGSVTSDHYAIRERQYLTVIVPRVGFTGKTVTGRVIARSLDDTRGLMTLTLQVLQEDVTAVRPRPPSRDAFTGGRSRAPIPQQLASLRRRIEWLERTS